MELSNSCSEYIISSTVCYLILCGLQLQMMKFLSKSEEIQSWITVQITKQYEFQLLLIFWLLVGRWAPLEVSSLWEAH